MIQLKAEVNKSVNNSFYSEQLSKPTFYYKKKPFAGINDSKNIKVENMVNVDERIRLIKEMVSKGLKQNDLEMVNGVLKAASIGIIPRDDAKMFELKEILVKKYLEESPESREKLYGTFLSVLKELPTNKKILNRGPIRHGMLGFKDNVVHGDKWSNLGPAGDFPRSVHQLSHQIPAPELGYICKAYAQYLRTNGNIQEFDRVLKENGVSFEEYFVKNTKRIAGNTGYWNQISSDKPKGIINASDQEMRSAFSHRGWTGKNVDELMSKPGSKVANFFDLYGDTIIKTLDGQGITLVNTTKELEKALKSETKKTIADLENIRNKVSEKNVDENWKQNEALPNIAKLATDIRKDIHKELLNTKDIKTIQALITFDTNLESIVDTTGMNILSKAPKENGLMYKLDNRTANLFLNLIDNYALTHNEHSKELNLIKRDLQEAFTHQKGNSQPWAESTMVPLNRLDRLIQKISNDTSEIYRPIATNLAKSNTNDSAAMGKVEQLADGILRGDLLFPVSQINAGFKSHVRKIAGGSPWQIVSAGIKAGKVVHAKNMEHLEEIIRTKNLSKQNLICFVDTLAGAEEPPQGVQAIITGKVVDTLAHIGVRARQEDIVFACIDEPKLYEDIKKKFASEVSYANLKVKDGNQISIDSLTEKEYNVLQVEKDKKEPEKKPVKVIIPQADLSSKECIIDTSKIKHSTSGPKATNIAKLANIVPIPESLDIPFGVFDKVLNASENSEIMQRYNKTLEVLNQKQKENDPTIDTYCIKLKELTKQLVIPKDIENEIMQKIKNTMPAGTTYVMTRSSTNGEDLADFSGAGLYSSQPNKIENVLEGVKIVWASKWNKRAYDARVKAEIPDKDLYVSVLIQPCIDTKYGFVTHTANPITKDPNQVFIELVQGQNEALVSGKIPGTGYGFIYDKKTGDVKRIHLADKSYQFLPSEMGGTKIELADYKDDILASDKKLWESYIKQIAEYSVNIEKLYNGVPQDIEGVIKAGNNKVFIVQTRDQLGL